MNLRTLLVGGVVLAIGVGSLTSASAQSSGITATFSPAVGVLTITGNSANNSIIVGRGAADEFVINDGQVPIVGGVATPSNTSRILIFGLGGDDELVVGPLSSTPPPPSATIFGGSGNDTITGSTGNDSLFGEDGNDTLNGSHGNDELFGGIGNDVLTGGTGLDIVSGDAGLDRLLWNPGDSSDFVEGGEGSDAIEFNGGGAAEIMTVTANGPRVKLERNIGSVTLDIGTVETLTIAGMAGNDTIAAGEGLANMIKLTFLGGEGDDTLLGSDGPDVLDGGAGNDTIMGNGGNDTASMGSGDDVFIWETVDGNDIVEGQGDRDTLRFIGDNGDETVNVSANGARMRFVRDGGSGNASLDVDDVEVVEYVAQAGTDAMTIRDLTATDALEVVLNLERQPGSGDFTPDSVTVVGTNAADTIAVSGVNGTYTVAGLKAAVRVVGSEAQDELIVTSLGGNDNLSAAGTVPDVMKLTLDGGTGNDTVRGGRGADSLKGGTGNDVFVWEPGDGSDVIEGQADRDTVRFNGANVAETISISANGTRARLLRNIANVALDLDTLEEITVVARGGADALTVNDLSGTPVKQVNLTLEQIDGTADQQPDLLTVYGSAANDVVRVDSTGGIRVTGLSTSVAITGAEAAHDQLTIATQDGDDRVDASALAIGSVRVLLLDGGMGSDRLVGSPGDDALDGGPGEDTLDGRAGVDVAANGEVLINIP